MTEPEAHRLDREAMLADRRAVAERIARETDEIAAAAVENRRVFSDWFVDYLLIERRQQSERERIAAESEARVAAAAARETTPSDQ